MDKKRVCLISTDGTNEILEMNKKPKMIDTYNQVMAGVV